MRRIFHILAFGAILTTTMTAARPAGAGSFEIAPTTITLNGSQQAVFYITNHADAPIVAQVEGYAWKQNGGSDQLDATDALIVSPPMMRIMPNQQQTVRLMAKSGLDPAKETSFRLIVSEIPDPSAPSTADKIRMLLQFSVPVFAGGAGGPSTPLAWNARTRQDGLALTASNAGRRHIKISSVALETSAGQKITADDGKFRYVLPGNSYTWSFPQTPTTAGQIIHIKALDETSSTPIDESIHVQ